MNLTLKRYRYDPSGIYGIITGADNKQLFVTLEHSFDNVPKIPPGVYTCRRGMHRLENMTKDFETFEVTNVPEHTNILLHVGNFNQDSSGCILLGMSARETSIGASGIAFDKFMALQEGLNEFELTVIE
jgi:hypothetical protein